VVSGSEGGPLSDSGVGFAILVPFFISCPHLMMKLSALMTRLTVCQTDPCLQDMFSSLSSVEYSQSRLAHGKHRLSDRFYFDRLLIEHLTGASSTQDQNVAVRPILEIH